MDFLSSRTRTTEEERPRVSFSNNRIGNNIITKILSKNHSKKETDQELNPIVDVDKDLQIFKQNQLKLLNPKTLYDTRYFSTNNHLYRHYREEQLSAIGDNITQINLVIPDSL